MEKAAGGGEGGGVGGKGGRTRATNLIILGSRLFQQENQDSRRRLRYWYKAG